MKKVAISFLVFLLLFTSFNVQVFADTIPYNKETTKIMVRGLGEKMGIMWTDKSLNTTVDYLHTKAYIEERDNHSIKEKGQMLADWANYIGNTNFVDGVATAVIGPEKWYDGMKAIYNAMEELDGEIPVEFYSPNSCLPPDVPVNEQALSFAMFESPSGATKWIFYFEKETTYTLSGNYHTIRNLNGGIVKKVELADIDGNGYKIYGSHSFSGTYTSEQFHVNNYIFKGHGLTGIEKLCPRVISDDEKINSSNMKESLRTSVINHYGNTSITSTIPVTYANTVVYDYSQPLNNSLTEDEIKELFKEVLDEQDPPDQPDPPKPEPEDKPESSSWWEWLIKPIAGAITGLGKVLESVLGAITGLVEAIGNLLMSLVVPDGDVLTEQFGSVKDTFDSKIPIINQLNDFFGQISDSTINETKPTFDVNIPEEWGGGTFPIIDFTVYDEYRDWVLNFIRFIAWFVFLKRLYNRIPRIIY